MCDVTCSTEEAIDKLHTIHCNILQHTETHCNTLQRTPVRRWRPLTCCTPFTACRLMPLASTAPSIDCVCIYMRVCVCVRVCMCACVRVVSVYAWVGWVGGGGGRPSTRGFLIGRLHRVSGGFSEYDRLDLFHIKSSG